MYQQINQIIQRFNYNEHLIINFNPMIRTSKRYHQKQSSLQDYSLNPIQIFKISAFSNQKYINSANHINLINEIIDERNLETWILMRQGDFINCDEQFMRRFYRHDQHSRKIQALTQYYKFHRNIPKIFDAPVQKILGYYFHKRRHLDYKQMKKQLKEQQGIDMTTQKDESSFSMTVNQQGKRSHYSDMLGPLNDNSSDSRFLHCFCEKAEEHFADVNLSEPKNFKKKKGFRHSNQNQNIQQNFRKIKDQNHIDFRDVQPIQGGNDSKFEVFLNQFFIKLQPEQKSNGSKRKTNEYNNFQHRRFFPHGQNCSKFRKSVLKGKTTHQSIDKQRYSNKYKSEKQRLNILNNNGNLNFNRQNLRNHKLKLKQKSKQNKSSNNQGISQEDQKQDLMKTITNRLSRGISKKKLNLKDLQNQNPNLERVCISRASHDNIKRKSNLKVKNLEKAYGIQSHENSKQDYVLDREKTMANKKKSSTIVFKNDRKLASANLNLKRNQTINNNGNRIADKLAQIEQQYQRRRSKSMKRMLKPAVNIQFEVQNQLKQRLLGNNQNRTLKRTEGSSSNLLKRKISTKSLFRSNSTNHNKPKTHRELRRIDNFTKQNQVVDAALRYSSSNFVKQPNFFNNGNKVAKKYDMDKNLNRQLTLQGLLSKKLENIMKPVNRIF